MKTTSAILSLLLAQSVNAFAPVGVSKTSQLNAATITQEVNGITEKVEVTPVVDAKSEEESSVKYQTDIEVEQKFKIKEVDNSQFDPNKRVQTGRYIDREMSVSVPFLKRPTKLDGSHAGDLGFDPLGLSEQFDLHTMMEAEIRHARLAMLAVVGWPLAELMGPNWMLHGPNHVSPSVLNGFDPLSFITTAAIFGGLGYFEYKTAFRNVDDTTLGKKHKEDMANVWKYGVPGDYNFDPLDWYSSMGDTATGRKAMREAEIAHGRWAMMGITGFAAWEALTGHPIVENSMFFHPNALLPALVVGYYGFNWFYEIENTDQYVFQVKMNSEGEARAENLKMRLGAMAKDGAVVAGEAAEQATVNAKTAMETYKDLKQKYEKFTNDYTEYSMRNIK